LQTFDSPNGDAACVRRARSNTPLQALTTLNEPLFVECAQALALRTVREPGKSTQDRLRDAFRRCVGRNPSDSEVEALSIFLARQAHGFSTGSHDPWQLAARDPKNPPEIPPDVTSAELAGWTAVARVLLNLDETITRP